MATNSAIEWTGSTWNPATGCSKISPGCKHCYADRMARRLKAMGRPNYANGFRLTLHDHALELPLTWKKPQMIFVNSMSDLFHEDIPLQFIQKVFDVMNRADWHTYQPTHSPKEQIKQHLDSEIRHIRFYLESQKVQVEQFNASAPDNILRSIQARKECIKAHEGTAGFLGIPLKRRVGGGLDWRLCVRKRMAVLPDQKRSKTGTNKCVP